MNRGDDESIALAHLLYTGVLSFDDVVEWAFEQYTDKGIDPYIEKIGLAIDIEEMYEILGSHGCGHPRDEFWIGAAASEYYKSGSLDLILALGHRGGWGINEINLPKDEANKLYDAVQTYDLYLEDCTDEAIQEQYERLRNISLELFDKYHPIYKKAVARFIP